MLSVKRLFTKISLTNKAPSHSKVIAPSTPSPSPSLPVSKNTHTQKMKRIIKKARHSLQKVIQKVIMVTSKVLKKPKCQHLVILASAPTEPSINYHFNRMQLANSVKATLKVKPAVKSPRGEFDMASSDLQIIQRPQVISVEPQFSLLKLIDNTDEPETKMLPFLNARSSSIIASKSSDSRQRDILAAFMSDRQKLTDLLVIIKIEIQVKLY